MKEKSTGFVKGIGNFLSLLKENKSLKNNSYADDETQLHTAKKYLDNVHEEHSFVLKNGERVSNLTELFYKLQKLDDEIYTHHVNEDKHDFAEWVHHCVEDKELAQSIRNLKDKDDLTIAVGERVRDHLTNINIR